MKIERTLTGGYIQDGKTAIILVEPDGKHVITKNGLDLFARMLKESEAQDRIRESVQAQEDRMTALIRIAQGWKEAFEISQQTIDTQKESLASFVNLRDNSMKPLIRSLQRRNQREGIN